MKIKAGFVVAGMLSMSFASVSLADVLANWTFETNTPADLANSVSSPNVNAEAGIFSGAASVASGLHASAATDWTTPSGNGSANSLSSNTWGIGDYYQFTTSTVGYAGIGITWDQTGSNTGPRDFKLQYSTNGTTFSDFANYQLINGNWDPSVPVGTTTFSYDLSSITALDGQATIWFRLTCTSTTAISGTFGAAGTGRVDNISIFSPVPAPGALALLGLAGLVGSRRRRA